MRTLLNRAMDVILVASCQPTTMEKPLVSDGKTPLLLIDRQFKSVKMNFIGSDDVMVGEMATNHLLRIGRRRIAHIGGVGTSPSVERLKGYRRALAEAGIGAPKNFVVTRERFEESGDIAGYQTMRELLSRRVRPDAVFCYNDLSAIGAMQAAMDAGFEIPRDIAFVGCGNLRYAPYLKVPLSSIDHATEQMGVAAAELAIDLATNPERKPQVTLLKPTLIVRQSSVADAT
jgi:LacI family transcriptional regulator